MTTVVAAALGGRVVMGADSATNVYDRPVLSARKIRRLTTGDGREFLLGFAGEGALPTIVERSLTVAASPDLADQSDVQKWADAIASAITELALDHKCTDNGKLDSTLILGFAGRVWSLTHHQAIAHTDGVAAVGSGEGPAIGAVDALLEQRARSTPNAPLTTAGLRELIHLAVRIAINRDKHSGGSCQVEVLENAQLYGSGNSVEADAREYTEAAPTTVDA